MCATGFQLSAYLAVAAMFALGLMAKPMLVTLPFVLLLLDYWPLGRVVAHTPCAVRCSDIRTMSDGPQSVPANLREDSFVRLGGRFVRRDR